MILLRVIEPIESNLKIPQLILQDLTDFKRDLSLLTERLGQAQDCL